MRPPRLSVAQLRRRIDELDALRLTRRLTEAERAEADNLAHRLYTYTWRGTAVPAARAMR